VKGFHRGGAEDPGDLMDAVVLRYLQAANEALLADPGVPNRGAVREDRNDECVVDLVPVEEVEAADGVAEDADAPDGEAGAVRHDLDVGRPVEVSVDKDP